MNYPELPEIIAGLPNISGSEEVVAREMGRRQRDAVPHGPLDLSAARSCFAIALHMHQPLIPAGGESLTSARIIGNLQAMMENLNVGDNHNAPMFQECYKRMGEIIPRLVREGGRPRVMLDYSGCLLFGLRQMGLNDVFDNLKIITCDPAYRDCVEWLGSAWGHAVAPSTPVQDYRLHVRAWQQHFAAIFGLEALGHVRGFSPAEMALPNHPDVFYEFVKTLKEAGYRWVLVQEHTVENVEDGGHVRHAHLPHRLVAKNSAGESLSMIAIIKTQGSDTKLVGQMQPYYEAKGLSRSSLAGKAVPEIVTQISDGENGGVIMNEFPSKYLQVRAEASHSDVPPTNIGEYLGYLESIGVIEDDLPSIQPIMQKRIWDAFPEGTGPEVMRKTIDELYRQDNRFNVEGGSWTNNISWVRGYQQVLGPMEAASASFSQKVLSRDVSPAESRYRNALFHLLLTQTSCFRYWGSGIWTDYGREICRRTMEILEHDF
jgi:hypothetical protein